MKILFYIGNYGDWFDQAVSISSWIAFWTRGPYSHTEIQFSDGICFSSTTRDDSTGVRFKYIDINWERWDALEIIMPLDHEAEIKSWCNTQVGKKYDFWGLFGFTIPFIVIQDPNSWYCSEIDNRALAIKNYMKIFARIHPNQMAQILHEHTKTQPEIYKWIEKKNNFT